MSLPGPASFLLTGTAVIENKSSSQILVSCKLALDLFHSFGQSSITIPPTDIFNSRGNATIIGSIGVPAGTVADVHVDCMLPADSSLISATVMAVSVGTLTISDLP